MFTVTNTSGLTSDPATVSISVSTVTASVTQTSVNWGTVGTAPLSTALDGLRLLPAGRSTDLPWLNINQFVITLSQAEPLSPADVLVTGMTVANYGPITVSGGNTQYVITLALPIANADRVTLTIGNANIATYTRRLDVVPGDFTDDGQVNSADILGVNRLIGAAPNVFADIDGNGTTDSNDVQWVRKKVGTRLPPLAP